MCFSLGGFIMKELIDELSNHGSYCISKMYEAIGNPEYIDVSKINFDEVERYLLQVRNKIDSLGYEPLNDNLQYCTKCLSEHFNKKKLLSCEELNIYITYYRVKVDEIIQQLKELNQ